MPRKKKTIEAVEEPRRFKHFGRPTKYTVALGEQICELIAEGKTLLGICKKEGMPKRRTVHGWLLDERHKDFLLNYTIARELQSDAWADEMLDIADNGTNDYVEDEETGERKINFDHIKRSDLRVRTRQWNAARRAPKKYGDRSALEMSGPDGQAIAPVTIYLPQKNPK